MRVLVLMFAILALTAPLLADSGDFSIEIAFDRNDCSFTLRDDDGSFVNKFRLRDARVGANEITAMGEVLLDEDGFHFGRTIVPFDQLTIDRVRTVRDDYRIVLERKVKRSEGRRRRGGDLVAVFEDLSVDEDEFIRGDVLVIGGILRVAGEVNGEVIDLFGDIRLSRTAVCQRNVLAIGGTIDRHHDARVYGASQATSDWRRSPSRRMRRYSTEENVVDLGATLFYNRVDGLAADVSVTFHSEEEFMPEFFAHYGYGFWSDRSKYRLGFEHHLFHYHRLSFGGQVYRLTKTEDDWICHTGENTAYALLAREDFRDYYEGEGGSFFVQQEIAYDHKFRLDYSFEELRFMEANPDQWSLFGGDKKFRSNFSSVEDHFFEKHLTDYGKDEGVLRAMYEYNTTEDRYGELLRSGWFGRIQLEHSSDGFGSDFDYDRWTVELRRYQPLTYRQNLNLRLIYGGSDGCLPMHRLFYLGGIRTLRAYGIKEFYGSHMAMANLEYVLDFPRTDIGVSLLFDVGKTGWDSDFLNEGEWIGDIGAACRVEDIRLELTRQLNGYTNDLQFSILIGNSF